MANKVSISTLPFKFDNLKEEFKLLKECGVDYIHCDIMDRVFVENITFQPCDLQKISNDLPLPLDVHLMMVEPLKHLEYLTNAEFITIHYEVFDNEFHLINAINQIKNMGIKAGVSIDLDTNIERARNILNYIDLVLIMSVKAGAGGQKFNEKAIDKIKYCNNYRTEQGLNFVIEVDGGINNQNVKSCVKAGADIVVSGSYVANSLNKKDAVGILKN